MKKGKKIEKKQENHKKDDLKCAKFTLSRQFNIKVRDTYKNTKIITNGINKISDKAANRKMFDVWSSTSEIMRRAPHHEF